MIVLSKIEGLVFADDASFSPCEMDTMFSLMTAVPASLDHSCTRDLGEKLAESVLESPTVVLTARR